VPKTKNISSSENLKLDSATPKRIAHNGTFITFFPQNRTHTPNKWPLALNSDEYPQENSSENKRIRKTERAIRSFRVLDGHMTPGIANVLEFRAQIMHYRYYSLATQ
jgi:hypothetical protein